MMSGRGHALVFGAHSADPPIVTVENYCKWYALQVVMPDSSIAEYDFGQLEPHAENYVADHCPSPVAVVRWARTMGFEVHDEELRRASRATYAAYAANAADAAAVRVVIPWSVVAAACDLER